MMQRRRLGPWVPWVAVPVLGLAMPAPARAQYTRVSVSTSGAEANGASTSPSISESGRYVAFVSEASNLVDGDTNGVADVFLRDRDTDGDTIFDEPGAVLTRRVNVSALGVQADAPAIAAKMSGRYIAFQTAATTLVPGVSPGVQRIFVVDFLLGVLGGSGPEIQVASVSTTGVPADQDCDEFDINSNGFGSFVVVFRSDSTMLVPGDAGSGGAIYARLSAEGRTVRLSPPLYPDPGGTQPRVTSPTLDVRAGTPGSGDPGYAGFAVVRSGATKTGRVYRCLPDGTQLEDIGEGIRIELGPFSHYTVTVLEEPARLVSTHVRRSVFGRDSERVLENLTASGMPVLSPDGRSWLAYQAGVAFVYDFLSGERTDVPFSSGDWRGDFIAFSAPDAFYVAGDTNQLRDVFVADVRRLFDRDGDTLDDRWERLSGLSTQDATGVNGPLGDPDGDGVPNTSEWYNSATFWLNNASTHPTGTTTRYLAEGVVNGFFDTQLHLVNPNPNAWASVQLRYHALTYPLLQPLLIPPLQHRTVSPGAESLFGDFGVAIESNVPVVVDRRVTWDRLTGYGAHLETAVAAPATNWYLTEGTTVLGFELFYLLQNPGTTFTTATVRYLRPSGPPIVRTYDLHPRSRVTIRVNGVDPELDETDVSAHVSAGQPIIAERAMYTNRHGQVFSLGTEAVGVTAPATSWFLAEGATGSFFDLYVLVANPGGSDAAVTARFLKPNGTVVTRAYTVAANSRFSVFVDAIAGLEDTPVSTEISSTNGVPIVVERAMYWPGGFFDYYEGHTTAGVTAPALRWAIAHGENGGPRQAQTYVLIANPSATPGEARVTLLPEVRPDILPPPPIPQVPPMVVPLPATSRVTLRVGQDGPSSRFGVLVESIGGAPVPIVVESAAYWSVGGQVWGAGGALVGTPVP